MSEDEKEALRSGSSTAAPETIRDRLRALFAVTPLRIELLVLGLTAAAPVLPYLFFLLVHGVPRYSLFSDFALIEHEARHVWTGDTLLGLGSRFGWHHPGPLFFYFVAPFIKLFGEASTGLFVGTCVLSMLAIVVPVIAMRLVAGRAHAIAGVVVMLAWLAAFGNVAANPWNRTVIALPLVAYFILIALVAKGSSACAIPGAFFGALVIETHISTVTTVGALGVLAVIAFGAGRLITRTKMARADWMRLGSAVLVLGLALSPIAIEERSTRHFGDGNITRLLEFLRLRKEPYKLWSVAFKDWGLATSWLPDRLFERTLASEGPIPLVLRWDPAPIALSRTATTILVVFFVALIATAIHAIKKKDGTILALILMGSLGCALATSALRAIAGEEHYSLLFWSAAPSLSIWCGAVAALFSSTAIARRARAIGTERIRRRVAAGVLGAAMLGATLLQSTWLERNPNGLFHGVETQRSLRAILTAVKERAAARQETPIIHLFGAWPVATASALELEKDGVDVRYSDADAWSFAGGKTSAGVSRPLHLYFDTPDDPLPVKGCVELIAKSGAMTVYGSHVERWSCPEPPPSDHVEVP